MVIPTTSEVDTEIVWLSSGQLHYYYTDTDCKATGDRPLCLLQLSVAKLHDRKLCPFCRLITTGTEDKT